MKCNCKCTGCAGICELPNWHYDGNCWLKFKYIEGDFLYRYDFLYDIIKSVGILDKDNNLHYAIIWNLEDEKTSITFFSLTDFTGDKDKNIVINSLISPFNISPERIKKLLTFS